MDCGLNTVELDRIYRAVRHRLLGEAPRPLLIAGRIVRRRLGTGGSGIVYAAYDPTLDREVAIKLVHRRSTAVGVLDEARALASIAHPNVVAIYDVGRDGDDVFIVMELVRGATLDVWRTGRTRAEIVGVLAEIADGLACVHAAGLCHGDVKPRNVIVGSDGRPRLVDFGLARARAEPGHAPAGTPGYLAPELRAGGAPSPRSDQWAFFVCVHEALRPAGRLAHVIARGLADDPDERFDDLGSAARALRSGGRSRPRRVLVGALAIAAAVVWARPADPKCTPPSIVLPLPAALDTGLTAQAGALGEQVATQLRARAAEWSASWSDAYATICRATWQHATQGEALLDVRMRCLDHARRAADALSVAIDPTDPGVPTLALAAVDALPRPTECITAEVAGASTHPELVATLERAQALRRLGKYGDARPLIVEVRTRAAELRSSALLAESGLELAAMDAQGADPPATIATLRETIAAAHEIGRVDLEASAWLSLVFVETVRTEQLDDARRDLVDARVAVRLGGRARDRIRLRSIEALLARADGDLEAAHTLLREAVDAAEAIAPPEPALVATMLSNLAGITRARGDVHGSRALEQRALDLRIAALGPAHPDVAASHMNLAMQCEREGDREGALQHYDRVLAVAEQIVGADEPGLARVYLPRAELLVALGESERARADLQRAIDLTADGQLPDVSARARAALETLH
ncbi:MAG TPA: serine/threonine-protein kinase [Nannocystaceae bacterium]|nr:serine/threonine-protein kinase [Nannocystaceae bacterium]